MMNLEQAMREAMEETDKWLASSSVKSGFDRMQKYTELLLAKLGGEAVITLLPADPYDDRDGCWMSLADAERLRAMTAGTKLFLAPPPDDRDKRIAELEEQIKSGTAVCDSYAKENQQFSDRIDELEADIAGARDLFELSKATIEGDRKRIATLEADLKVSAEGQHQLTEMVKKLEAQRDAAVNDTLRLNWLESNPRHAQIVIEGRATDCVFYGISCAQLTNVRTAIDAVIAKDKEKKE